MKEFLHLAAIVFGILAGSLWALIGVLLAGVGWVTVRDRVAAIFWPRVPARIVVSEVRPVRSLEDQKLFQPVVSYVFAAEGKEVASGKLAFVGKLYGSEERARKEIERFPVGMVIMARTNPREPSEAVLEGRGGVAGVLMLLLGLLMTAAPLAVAAGFGLPAWPLAALLLLAVVVALLLDSRSRRQLRQARRAGIYPLPGGGTDADVERLLREGERMLAIRLYREIHATDLKTARRRVAEMLSSSH